MNDLILNDVDLLNIIDFKMLELDNVDDNDEAEIVFLMNCRANILEKQTLAVDKAYVEGELSLYRQLAGRCYEV